MCYIAYLDLCLESKPIEIAKQIMAESNDVSSKEYFNVISLGLECGSQEALEALKALKQRQ